MSEFKVDIHLPPSRADAAVIRLSGTLDTYCLGELEKTFENLIRENRNHLIVNCEQLKFISSAGMGLFLGTLGEVEKDGGTLCFAKVSEPEVHDAMSLLGFFDVFKIFENEEEAIRVNLAKA